MTETSDKSVKAYLSDDLYKSVQLYSQYHNLSVSKAVSELIIQGLSGFTADATQDTVSMPSQPFLPSPDLSQYVTRSELDTILHNLLISLGQTYGHVEALSVFNESALEKMKQHSHSSKKRLSQPKNRSLSTELNPRGFSPKKPM